MALEAIAVLMMSHGDAAVGALHGGAAASAKDGPGISAAVDEHQGLGFVGEAFLNPGVQRRANGAGLMGARDIIQRGVQDSDTLEACAKPSTALAANPEGQCDFRNENDGGFATRESVLDGAHIDFRLAASGDAVKQEDSKFAELETRANL